MLVILNVLFAVQTPGNNCNSHAVIHSTFAYTMRQKVKDVNGRAYLHLENWDSSLAVAAREEQLASEGFVGSDGVGKKFRNQKMGIFKVRRPL
ncbi:hypothetical protein ABKV19_005551 [Rosa sericea]